MKTIDFFNGENTVHTGEEILFSFTRDEINFVGDLNVFTYDWIIESSSIPMDAITLEQPIDYIGSGSIRSTIAGQLVLRLTVKDRGEVLDTETAVVNFTQP